MTERDVRDYLNQLPKVTPVAQRMAADVGVDLRGVVGSGPGGRIVKQDVTRAAQPTPPVAQPLPVADVVERVPLKGVRGIIAERMAASVHTTARVTLVMEVDATEFVAARERIKAKVSKEWGFAPGYNDLLAKIVAVALRQFPYMNARLAPDAIELLGHVNIGMAVDTDRGLLVPVVKDADQKESASVRGRLPPHGGWRPRWAFPARRLERRNIHHHQSGHVRCGCLHPGHQPARSRNSRRGTHCPESRAAWNRNRHTPDVDAVSGLRSSPRGWRPSGTFPANDQNAHRRSCVVYYVYVRLDRKRISIDLFYSQCPTKALSKTRWGIFPSHTKG